MSAKYELQDILHVRDHRKERAQEALFKAKQSLAAAEEFLQSQQEKESDFLKKKPKFIQTIYEQAFQKAKFKRNYLDIIHFKLGKLEEHQMKLAMEVKKAQNKCEKAHQKVVACAQTLTRARIEMSKIEEHKKIWIENQHHVEEQAQDKELEDFKTKPHHA